MEHFAIITKEEHTGVCMLRPTVTVMVGNRKNGEISVDISGSDDTGDSVFFTLGCGDFKGRYIEDYDKEIQETILDGIETCIARDIALFIQMGYTYVGVDKAAGGDASDCFYLEDHKDKWQKNYRCTLEYCQQKYANTYNRE